MAKLLQVSLFGAKWVRINLHQQLQGPNTGMLAYCIIGVVDMASSIKIPYQPNFARE